MRILEIVVDLFIPHEKNDHKPHFLRSDNVQTLLILVLLAQAFYLTYAFVIAPGNSQVAAVIASTLVEQTNTERTKTLLPSLTTNEQLVSSAQMKADHMAQYGYFAHNSPDGTTPWYWFKQAGYQYQNAGENLAVNFIESSDVTTAWMNSPTHRDNILNAKFSEIGIATAVGKYKGRDAIFVVQHFGRRHNTPATQAQRIPKLQETASQHQQNSVLGTSVEQKPLSLIEKTISYIPKFSISLQYAIIIVAIVALVLAAVIRIQKQHPILIANGFMLVAITIGIIFMNTLIAQGSI